MALFSEISISLLCLPGPGALSARAEEAGIGLAQPIGGDADMIRRQVTHH